MSEHPFLADDYHIRWSTLKPEHVKPDIEHALALANERLEVIRNLSEDELSYETTFGALEVASEELERGWGRLSHLDSVCDNAEQRAALNEMLPQVSSFYSSIPLDEKIWKSLKAYAESYAVKELSPVKQRLVEETCADFIAAGADLSDDKKKRVSEIDAELSKLTKKFSENVLDSTNAWELIVDDEARLKGLPEMAKEGARLDALSNGHGSEDDPKWRFTLQYPSMGPVMQHAEDESLRKQVWEANCTVGFGGDFDNTQYVWQILELRQEKAAILGKDNFCDLILERRMAKNGKAALKFIEDLHDRIFEAFKIDLAELAEYKAVKTGDEPAPLQPWEGGYWAEKRRKEQYAFDDEALRPYFSVTNVMKGMFDITSKLFGIHIEEREAVFGEDREGAVQVWHPECCYYDVFDSDTQEHLGSFYADWHPRSSKRGGAWMNSLKTGGPCEKGGPRKPHIGLMVGNMTKPVGDTPALLTHNEVETIFHEFGHLLHHLLGDVEVKSLSGTSVPWDFVELPSQIMENFCWDRESLDLFARHYETGEVIPDDLFEKMIAARNYMSASNFMRQLCFGKLDMELHLNLAKYKGRDLDVVDEEILKEYRADLATKSPSMARRFSHLFSGPVAYASGYYSYKWSEVLDADAFTRFQKEGILNSSTGRAFRKEVLARGNSRPVDESYRAFMGRDPELEPLLERAGLA
ncbi:oligopeptidase A . Metallo peptidase. MEROPS family M03A [Rubritalea squalenifaciens DSM 18772]|uniref:oligopeptidase A n=1 Tax=Rubritalea squalenifaciens DSM 18772 TaxID=1123071 RepID=A0A1M6AYQ7_9BACT|nr:M3 family metallopeptidase [Rubritalea squalenifaciens]SHI41592.1 oligopeptidase A . Metallo peptidase. MEROPS family M03A [Rubritalea squalenifaciens DSM 18772]